MSTQMKPINLQRHLQPMFVREVVIKAIRSFFDEQDFHEIISPIFNETVPLEPTVFPFLSQWQTRDGERSLYLTTSPEKSLKKMLAAGVENCYAIGKSCRNLESAGRIHNPEFLMLEWYRSGSTYEDIMRDVEVLLRCVKKKVDEYLGGDVLPELNQEWIVLSLANLFEKYVGEKLEMLIDEETMNSFAQKKGYAIQDATWEQLFHQIVLNEIEPHFPAEPFFLTDFPSKISPLCAVQKERPFLAQRFEVFLNGMEIGNGNTELLDSVQVRKNFETEAHYRRIASLQSHSIDEDFIAALNKMRESGKSFAGIGMGIDRLAMIFAGVQTIREVEPFCVSGLFSSQKN